jgi:hypothetical protein
MALIETADQQLVAVAEAVKQATAAVESVKETLRRDYRTLVGREPDDSRYHQQVCSAFMDELRRPTIIDELSAFASEYAFLGPQIAERADHDRLCTQSCCLLLLLELTRNRYNVEHKWPLSGDLLNGLFALLGISR